ncbi:Hypothetical protein NTJ_15536 [Nesidiocoris tenuis]|uniref:Uncharacterized protein n=1 Tax=Nesidiocoris tenuis TaxID=355587 RepID=A0ABN7BEB9_9HEMI|nr:Hypothetical protein NTJ_15536 [Nesidiocoris tenuis]
MPGRRKDNGRYPYPYQLEPAGPPELGKSRERIQGLRERGKNWENNNDNGISPQKAAFYIWRKRFENKGYKR